MQRKKLAALATATLAAAAMTLPLTAPQVNAAPASTKAPAAAAPDRDNEHGTGDNLLQPWQRKYEAIRKVGVEQRLRSAGGVARTLLNWESQRKRRGSRPSALSQR